MSDENIKKKFKNAQIFQLKQNYVDDIIKKLNKKIPFSGTHSSEKEFTYKEILDVLDKNNVVIYILGGTIRNLLQKENIDNDIDIYVDITPEKLEKIFYKNLSSKFLKWYHSPNFKPYFLIGQKECSDEFLEIMCSDVYDKKSDAPCNSLFVRYSDFMLYDLSGYGIIDTVKKIWRKPPETKFDEWMKGRDILWRMIKFKLKKYKIDLTLSEKTKIYRHWTDNMGTMPKDWLIPWRNNLDRKDIHKILKILDEDGKNTKINFIDILTVFIKNNIFHGFHTCSELKSRNQESKSNPESKTNQESKTNSESKSNQESKGNQKKSKGNQKKSKSNQKSKSNHKSKSNQK